MNKTPKRPLEISCKKTACGPEVPAPRKRHAFAFDSAALPGMEMRCRGCDRTDLVDWERVRRLDQTDVAGVVAELRKELIRDNYWSEPLPERILRNASRRGPDALHVSGGKLLVSAFKCSPRWDGRQTPFAYKPSATIIHCAQHGTATCCRKCLETWYGIPGDSSVSETELRFFCSLVDGYTLDRLARRDEVTFIEAA